MRVLVIEDNPADAALVRALLRDPPGAYETAFAQRVAEAEAHLRDRRFDVALLDMSLPDAEGVDALHRVRDASPTLPIVILSGQDDEALATKAVAAGAQDYLLKGHVTELTLRRALGYAIERQEMHERLTASIDELEDQRAAVIRLNQLKNDLITVLAHDFKGPLTTILGFAELIEEGALVGDDARDAAGTIRRNVFRLTTLANDTLALSRIEHGELEIAEEPVDLVALLREIVERTDEPERFTITATADGTIVPGDRERLRQVFENLLRNALKYSPDETPVSVAVRDGEGGFVRVDITDRGIGIPPEEIPSLFRRFARASNAKKARIPGTGLGLFVVKTLVEKHGGKLALHSEVDRGSTFSVSLPRSGAIERAPQVAVVVGGATLGPFIAYELRSNGYRVREYKDLAELHSRFAAEPSDAVIIDRDRHPGDAASVRGTLNGSTPRLVAIGGAKNAAGWDASLPKTFLAADLLAALTSAR
ncbi:MAG TPA: ATP-binding protein [Candidatus Baltobacteraceae bacterium]|jgi:signal transduction histidine kinase